MEVDKTGLDSRVFAGFAETSNRRYVYICNMKTYVSRWSEKAVKYFGLPSEYMENGAELWAERIHPEDRERYLQDLYAVFSGAKDRHEMDYRVMNKDGEYVMCTCKGVVIRGENDDEPDLFVGAITNHSIHDNVDATTNLYNIFEFRQDFRGLKASNQSAIILMMGINNFSEINDVYGYEFGDKVLREFGSELYKIINGQGRLYRMDGVRFVGCFVDKEVDQIKELYERIKYVARHKVYIDGVRVAISVSAGMVLYNDDYDEHSLLSSARYAFEKSKHDYHGEVVLFDNSTMSNNRKNIELMDALRKSILNGCDGFYLCYQPIVDATDEILIGAEALLRWYKEPYGQMMPGIFIPWLENDPSFFELGNWIMKQAMWECRPVLEKYPNFVLNVNIAYTQLSRIQFRDAVIEILNETGFPPKNLCLELTERCRQLERGYLQNEVAFLRSLGIKIAIDDFGTGFSSLDLLSFLSVDTMKIDRGFISGIQNNPANQAIVRAITECASDMDVHVCMEGLEDRELIDFVKQYSVYSYQGYYFSKPITMKEFVEKYN